MKRKAYGTYDIAKICQVAPITVGRWIEEGKVPYFTTGGGHRRVWDEDLVKFLTEHNYPVPKSLHINTAPTVLIVDDEAALRRMIKRGFAKVHPHVIIHEAANGFEAGEFISATPPSLVILDLRLPGLDGVKVCKRIRLNKAFDRVKILAVTGESPKESREKVMAAGANAFLAKPFQIDELLTVSGQLLGLTK